MSSLRLQRVRELLKRTVSEIIRRELPVDSVGLISVNDVGVAADLQTATVFVSVIGTAEQKKKAATLLQSEHKHIQILLGKAIVLKYTPVLKFVVDDSIERGNRVLKIIEEMEKSDPNT